jgi:putative transposase
MAYEYKQSYRRKLPHLHSPGATLFVTFRLGGTIPNNIITKWKSEKIWITQELERIDKLVKENAEKINKKHKERMTEYHRSWFVKFEDILHKEEAGPVWLKNLHIANIIADSLQYRDGKVYRLDAYCIMSNHVHVVFAPFLNERSLKEVKGSNPLRYESEEPTLGIIMQSLKGHTA